MEVHHRGAGRGKRRVGGSELPPFLYLELAPEPALTPFVQSYWEFHVRGPSPVPLHTVWPDGCLSFVCRIRTGEKVLVAYSGPRTGAIQVPVREGDRFRGVRLRPYAIPPLLQMDPGSLRDRGGPAADILREASAALSAPMAAEGAFDVLEADLVDRATRAPDPDPVARRAVEEIDASNGARSISEVARRVELGARQLRRRFRAATGLSPKEYARVRRFRTATVERITAGAEWAAVAARFGYADQAHLIREFARMTGLTPTTLEKRLRLIEHQDVHP